MILFIASFIAFQTGIILGALAFDMFVSRPTLRILNEEIKQRESVLLKLTEYTKSLEFQVSNRRRIEQDDQIGNYK